LWNKSNHIGGGVFTMVEKKNILLFAIASLILFLSACSNSLHDELGVEADNVPAYNETDRQELANKHLISVKLVSEGSSEEEAKKVIADSFSMLQEHYRTVVIELADKDKRNWYGVYMQGDTVINYIQDNQSEEQTETEKLLNDYYKDLDNPEFPILKFSKDPILSK
jgi:hypothetical protein